MEDQAQEVGLLIRLGKAILMDSVKEKLNQLIE